jgi:pilus assembly protein CpaD
MTAIFTASVRGRSRAVLRALMASCVAVTLAGCYQTEVAEKEYPTDYRQRHPIVLRQGAQNVDILLGRNRGGLTASQRADVVSFAQAWRKGSGQRNCYRGSKGRPDRSRRLMQRARSVRSLPPSAFRQAIYARSYHPPKTSLASIRLNYTEDDCGGGTCAENGQGSGPSDRDLDYSNQPYWNFGCAMQRNLAAGGRQSL